MVYKEIPEKPEDAAKIVVPDGHLEGILREIFKRMGLPYPETSNSKESYGIDCVYEMENGGKQKIYLSVHRPQDSPGYVRDGYFIAGISGLDCWIDGLNIPLSDDTENDFQKGLKRRGLVQLIDLKYRPSSVVLAVHKDSAIKTKREFEEIYSNGRGIVVGSEFVTMPKNYARKTGVNVEEYKITRGKTESLIRDCIAGAIIEIAETGNRIKGNDGRIIGSLISKTTPRFVARLESLENEYSAFLMDFKNRMASVISDMKKEDKYKKNFRVNPLQRKLQKTKSDRVVCRL